MTGVVNLIILGGMLVVIPAGLRLIDGPGLARMRRFWLVGGVAGGVSLWLGRGLWTAGLAGVYALALTVAHFHYAGFAAAMVAGLVCRAAHDGLLASTAALSVPTGTALVLAGYFLNNVVELAGTAVPTVGMWLVGWLTWREVRPATTDRLTRLLFATSAAVLIATMLLALDWALGEAIGLPRLSLSGMATTHGVCNAIGFTLCAIAAWRRLRVVAL